MRIRATKPEFWRSKTIASLGWDVRLVLKGLESYVDDNGVGKDDIALIAADVFPRDLSGNTRETLARLSEAISQLANAGLIARYEVDGEELLYIDRWKQFQRIDKPGKGRFRRPDGTLEYHEDVSRESYGRAPETLAPVTGEQGNRGTEEQEEDMSEVADAPSDDDPDLDDVPPVEEDRPDIERVCRHLQQRMVGNGFQRPPLTDRWRVAARMLMDRDGRTEEQVHAAIDWAHDSDFWRPNIKSMPTLRKQFTTMHLQALAEAKKSAGPTDEATAQVQRYMERQGGNAA